MLSSPIASFVSLMCTAFLILRFWDRHIESFTMSIKIFYDEDMLDAITKVCLFYLAIYSLYNILGI